MHSFGDGLVAVQKAVAEFGAPTHPDLAQRRGCLVGHGAHRGTTNLSDVAIAETIQEETRDGTLGFGEILWKAGIEPGRAQNDDVLSATAYFVRFDARVALVTLVEQLAEQCPGLEP
jgi:hypothetical protein